MADRSGGIRFAAVVLCAGESRRWGELGPKALARIRGRPALERIATTARDGGISFVLGVLGAGASQIRSAGIHGIDAFVENPAFQAGRTGSIQSGLAAVPAGWGALIWPVDVPFVEAKTVRALVAAAEHETVAIWFTPTFDGRGGHPIALAPEAIRQAGVIPEGVPFRDSPFRKGLGELRVPVTDPGVLDNTNTPAEWSRAERAWRDRSGS